MNKPDTIHFALMGIETHQYAVIKDSYKPDEETMLQVGANVGASNEVHAISIFFEVRFISKDTPFVILETECQFDIEEDVFNSYYNTTQTSLTIPRDLCLHLGTITVGTTRGILYEKLKDTHFKHLLLPTVNLTEHFTQDMVLSKSGITE